jgi:hypothetical protein
VTGVFSGAIHCEEATESRKSCMDESSCRVRLDFLDKSVTDEFGAARCNREDA